MGYRALLFCPDEKIARTVTQVLNELEFTVEVAAEPFGVVKKLMGEHYDGVVVDCENEQNATLIFKSARNSASNQASLAIAVVEGQAGVAKAFRIGANLVLTKPINIEQAKGTLRVARGLLRKGEPAPAAPARAEASAQAPVVSKAKPALVKPQATGAKALSAAMQAASTRPVQKPAVSNEMKSEIPAPWGKHPSAPPGGALSAETEQGIDEISIETAVEENDADLAAALAPAPVISLPPITPSSSTVPPIRPGAPLTAAPIAGSGAASAPAPARIAQDSEVSAIPAVTTGLEALPSPAAESRAAETAVPAFSMLGANASQPSEGNSKKVLLAVAAVALCAVALYLGWNQLHPRTNSPAPQANPAVPANLLPHPAPPSAPAQSVPDAATPAPTSAAPAADDTTAPQSADSAEQNSNDAGEAESTPQPVHAAHPNARSAPASQPSATASKQTSQAIVVNGGSRGGVKKAAASDSTPPTVLVADNSTNALPADLVDTPTSAAAPVLDTVKVSQGVSQGLLVKKTQAVYPAAALRMHKEGPVRLLETIGKDGNILTVKSLSGDPLLVKAAMDAVKQWRYKPYLLNGDPVEIQTEVIVNFKLPN